MGWKAVCFMAVVFLAIGRARAAPAGIDAETDVNGVRLGDVPSTRKDAHAWQRLKAGAYVRTDEKPTWKGIAVQRIVFAVGRWEEGVVAFANATSGKACVDLAKLLLAQWGPAESLQVGKNWQAWRGTRLEADLDARDHALCILSIGKRALPVEPLPRLPQRP